MGLRELLADYGVRLANLEDRRVGLNDLPLASLERWLLERLTLDGDTALLPKSVGPDALEKVPYARLKSSTATTLVNSTHTLIPFDAEVFDNYDMLQPVPTSRITFQLPGVYLLVATVAFDGTDTMLSKATITLNTNGTYAASAELGASEDKQGGASIVSRTATAVRHFAKDDHVQVWAWHNRGADHAMYQEGATNERYPSFTAVWLGNF